jgi:hypothetical protein
MLDLGGATSLEVLHASVGGKAGGIPETHGSLNAQLIFECRQSHLTRKWNFNCLASLGGIAVFSVGVLKKMATVTRSGSSRYHRADHGEHNDIDIMVSLLTAHGAGDDSDVTP